MSEARKVTKREWYEGFPVLDWNDDEIDEPIVTTYRQGGLSSILIPKPKPQRIAPTIAADHTMRAQALLQLSDTKTGDMKVKAQNLALQHLEAAFVSANPGYGPNG